MSLGWEPHLEFVAHVTLERPLVLVRQHVTDGVDLDGRACACERCVTERRTAATLDERWIDAGDAVEITGKWELKLTAGLPHRAQIASPGEVVALALPALDGLLLTSTAHAVAALVDDLALTPTCPPPSPRCGLPRHRQRRDPPHPDRPTAARPHRPTAQHARHQPRRDAGRGDR